MASIANASPAVKSDQDTPGERDLLLNALRAAATRSRLISTELDTVGISLRHRKVNCEQALTWLRDEGLLRWVRLGPEAPQ
jgi:hypothetical protein